MPDQVDSNIAESRLHVLIGGRVQGVGFRMFVQKQAVRLELKGWVRNRWDGQVEVIAEGGRKQLEEFLGQLRIGPRSSYVSDLKFSWLDYTGGFSDFSIRRTE